MYVLLGLKFIVHLHPFLNERKTWKVYKYSKILFCALKV